jgi:hypothetical protein
MSKFNQQLGQNYRTPIDKLSSIGQVKSNGNPIAKVCQPLSLVNDLQNGYKSRMKSSSCKLHSIVHFPQKHLDMLSSSKRILLHQMLNL